MDPADAWRTWPLDDGPDADGRWDWSRSDRSVRESMVNILLTRPGERLMRPELGAGVTRFIHRGNDATTRGLLAGEAQRAVQRDEPRVELESVVASTLPAQPTHVALTLRYRRRHDGRSDRIDLDLAL